MPNREKIRERLHLANEIPAQTVDLIHREKCLQIWVSKEFGGLDKSFCEGLELLFELAQTDGSLGWFVTLCAGANYFSKNLQPQTAKEIFSEKNVCLGGSGMVGGTAEMHGNFWLVNGTWKYATGAPLLSHFTLNAKADEQILSFIIPKKQVRIIPDWNAMGMCATNTFSFEVKNAKVPANYCFRYDQFFTKDQTSEIPFRVFADLTLLVNYLGMAEHFAELTRADELKLYTEKALQKTIFYAREIEMRIAKSELIAENFAEEIHLFGEQTVADLGVLIIRFYTQNGIAASRTNSAINQVFRDFFTATQHANFRKKKTIS